MNQSAHGTDKVNAIVNCHLATGRIGKPGAGPLSLTGQPNAMGGREVGGLANMLAAHMGFSAAERGRVRRFWNAPNLVEGEGHKAVRMFEAVAAGEIKLLWVMGTNPAVSLPRADHVRAALARLELLVVSENVASNDTANLAQVRLPAAAWGEKDGTVTNSERRISRQRAFLDVPGEARPDWWILSQVAARLGWAEAFSYRSAADIFREHARLSGFENDSERLFDVSGLARLSDAQYAALAPVQWPVRRQGEDSRRLFGDGRFLTANGRARIVAIESGRTATKITEAWPFVLNTGRVRDQWHTMTRTGLSARLSAHVSEPFVEMHPDDAAALGLDQGMLAHLETEHGAALLRVMLNEGQQPGSLFVPIHWSAENSSSGRIGDLVQPVVDLHLGSARRQGDARTRRGGAGQPLWFRAVAVARDTVASLTYWARARMPAGYVTSWPSTRRPRGGASGAGACSRRASASPTRTSARGNTVARCCAMGASRRCSMSRPARPCRHWNGSRPASTSRPSPAPTADRCWLDVLVGAADAGPIVCACFQVGRTRIEAAVAGGASSVAEIGAATARGHQLRLMRAGAQAAGRRGACPSCGSGGVGRCGRSRPARPARRACARWPSCRCSSSWRASARS